MAPPTLGSVLDRVAEPLRDFYRSGFSGVRETGKPWSHRYECSIALIYRKMSARVDLAPHRDAFVVVHSTVIEAPFRGASAKTLDPRSYANDRGLIVQCANCRRVQRGKNRGVWDWLPQVFSLAPGNLSHGLCSTCETLYYSGAESA